MGLSHLLLCPSRAPGLFFPTLFFPGAAQRAPQWRGLPASVPNHHATLPSALPTPCPVSICSMAFITFWNTLRLFVCLLSAFPLEWSFLGAERVPCVSPGPATAPGTQELPSNERGSECMAGRASLSHAPTPSGAPNPWPSFSAELRGNKPLLAAQSPGNPCT